MTGPLTPPQIKLFTAAVKVVKFAGPLPLGLIVYVPFKAGQSVHCAVSFEGAISDTPFGEVVYTFKLDVPAPKVNGFVNVKETVAQGAKEPAQAWVTTVPPFTV